MKSPRLLINNRIIKKFVEVIKFSSNFLFNLEIESREEKSKVLFDFEETVDDDPLTRELDQVWAKDDLTYLEENTKYVKQREKEIHQIVQSISDLNTIFKELASMVTEQVDISYLFLFFNCAIVFF